MLTAFGTAVVLGIILGLVAATGRNSWRDKVCASARGIKVALARSGRAADRANTWD